MAARRFMATRLSGSWFLLSWALLSVCVPQVSASPTLVQSFTLNDNAVYSLRSDEISSVGLDVYWTFCTQLPFVVKIDFTFMSIREFCPQPSCGRVRVYNGIDATQQDSLALTLVNNVPEAFPSVKSTSECCALRWTRPTFSAADLSWSLNYTSTLNSTLPPTVAPTPVPTPFTPLQDTDAIQSDPTVPEEVNWFWFLIFVACCVLIAGIVALRRHHRRKKELELEAIRQAETIKRNRERWELQRKEELKRLEMRQESEDNLDYTPSWSNAEDEQEASLRLSDSHVELSVSRLSQIQEQEQWQSLHLVQQREQWQSNALPPGVSGVGPLSIGRPSISPRQMSPRGSIGSNTSYNSNPVPLGAIAMGYPSYPDHDERKDKRDADAASITGSTGGFAGHYVGGVPAAGATSGAAAQEDEDSDSDFSSPSWSREDDGQRRRIGEPSEANLHGQPARGAAAASGRADQSTGRQPTVASTGPGPTSGSLARLPNSISWKNVPKATRPLSPSIAYKDRRDDHKEGPEDGPGSVRSNSAHSLNSSQAVSPRSARSPRSPRDLAPSASFKPKPAPKEHLPSTIGFKPNYADVNTSTNASNPASGKSEGPQGPPSLPSLPASQRSGPQSLERPPTLPNSPGTSPPGSQAPGLPGSHGGPSDQGSHNRSKPSSPRELPAVASFKPEPVATIPLSQSVGFKARRNTNTYGPTLPMSVRAATGSGEEGPGHTAANSGALNTESGNEEETDPEVEVEPTTPMKAKKKAAKGRKTAGGPGPGTIAAVPGGKQTGPKRSRTPVGRAKGKAGPASASASASGGAGKSPRRLSNTGKTSAASTPRKAASAAGKAAKKGKQQPQGDKALPALSVSRGIDKDKPPAASAASAPEDDAGSAPERSQSDFESPDWSESN